MKILLLSDIHGNYEALKSAVSSVEYDELLFLGDAVDYGPQPAEVVDFLKENSSYNIMGNHDYAVAYNEDCKCAPAMHELSEFSRMNISMKVLGKNDIDKIKSFKEEITAELGGLKFYMTHASPYNNKYGYMFSTEAEMVSRDKNLSGYDYIIVGHTHFPMMYRSRILNPGSAGQPRDGKWTPWYAIMDTEGPEVAFRRFKYDNGKTIGALREIVGNNPEKFRKLSSYYQ